MLVENGSFLVIFLFFRMVRMVLLWSFAAVELFGALFSELFGALCSDRFRVLALKSFVELQQTIALVSCLEKACAIHDCRSLVRGAPVRLLRELRVEEQNVDLPLAYERRDMRFPSCVRQPTVACHDAAYGPGNIRGTC